MGGPSSTRLLAVPGSWEKLTGRSFKSHTFKKIFKDGICLFLEGRGGRETERERNNARPQLGRDLGNNSATSPKWEPNQGLLGSQARAQSTH